MNSTPSPMPKKNIALVVVGSIFCLLGLISNEYIANLFVSPNLTEILPGRVRAALWIINAALVAWGVTTILLRRKAFVVNLNLALASVLIITPLAGELFIRTAIALEVDFFRNPRLYAGWLDDDDHWKLRYMWQKSGAELEGGGFVPDPLLGWAPARTPQNPLGVLTTRPYQPDFGAKTVLFYGDSYVYGMSPTPIEQRVPQQLDRFLPDFAVYNYGVVGYAIDQIFLRFRETHAAFGRPVVVIGIYTLDLDRSIFTVREAPKPYFEIEDDRLVLKGTPVSDNMDAWLEQHPPALNSYLLAFIVRQYRIMSGGFQLTEIPYKQAQKKAVNAKIIEEMVAVARTHDLPLLFVLFYPEWEFGYQGWREIFLREQFQRLDVPFIDTKQLFLQQVEKPGQISQFYDHRHGHLNELGGQVVAEAIAAYLDQAASRPEVGND